LIGQCWTDRPPFCPCPELFSTPRLPLWKVQLPTGVDVSVATRGNVEDSIRTSGRRVDDRSLLKRGIRGRELRRRVRAFTLGLSPEQRGDCELDDEALWPLFRDHVIEHDGLTDLPDDALDTSLPRGLNLMRAHAPPRLRAVLEEVGPDNDGDPDGAGKC
jgi:hypothetical protein